MRKIRDAIRARLAGGSASRGKDGGFTMLETVVVLAIMSVVLVIFTTGIQQAFSAEDNVSAATNADAQIVVAFQRLDKEIRYSTGISTPGTSNGDPVVEFLTSFTGTSTCTEVRLHTSTGQLQQRTWTQGMSPLVPGAWVQLASNTSGATPFTLSLPDSTYQFQRLNINVNIIYGAGKTSVTKQSNITFTALDTTSSTSSASTCTEGRGVSW